MLTGMFAGGGGIDANLEVGVEKAVGTITINGTTYTRYVKIIDFGALPNNTTKSVAHNITGLVGVLGVYGMSKNPSNNECLSLPNYLAYPLGLMVTSQEVRVNTTNSTWYTSFTQTYITIEYYR